MIDIVIPLGTESRWQDNELRYTLRAIEKYLTGYRDIYIIGHPRKWLKEKTKVKVDNCSVTYPGVTFIPAEDNHTEKQRSIYQKILKAAKDDRITGTFAMWNDDHYLLQPLEITNIKYWYYSTVERLGQLSGGTYQRICINSNNYLMSKGYGNRNFDIHTPILFEKEKFVQLEAENWSLEHIIKSLYCNRWGIEGEEMRDLKFGKPFRREEIRAAIQNRLWFSISEHGTNDAMKDILAELYPEKSKYEI